MTGSGTSTSTDTEGPAITAAVCPWLTNTRNTPIEALERAFPPRVTCYRLRRGCGGAGWSAGGEGIERDLQVLEDATVSLITERRAERLPDKCTIQLKADDVLRMLTPGGGGWGPPGA